MRKTYSSGATQNILRYEKTRGYFVPEICNSAGKMMNSRGSIMFFVLRTIKIEDRYRHSLGEPLSFCVKAALCLFGSYTRSTVVLLQHTR